MKLMESLSSSNNDNSRVQWVNECTWFNCFQILQRLPNAFPNFSQAFHISGTVYLSNHFTEIVSTLQKKIISYANIVFILVYLSTIHHLS